MGEENSDIEKPAISKAEVPHSSFHRHFLNSYIIKVLSAQFQRITLYSI
jgi:hypothetical protein